MKRSTKCTCKDTCLVTIVQRRPGGNNLQLQEVGTDVRCTRRIKPISELHPEDFSSGVASHRAYIETEFCCVRNLLIHVSPLDVAGDTLRQFTRTSSETDMPPRSLRPVLYFASPSTSFLEIQ